MADNVAVTTLEIRGTEKVATTMKELREQIKSYRDELVALGPVSEMDEKKLEEHSRVVQKLAKDKKLLAEVTRVEKDSLAAQAREVDILNDSYNDLQAEMSRLKRAYKDMSAAERDSDIGAQTLSNIQQLDVKLKDLDAGMGQFQRNVGNYGQTFEESMSKARQNTGFLEQGMGTLMSVMGLAGAENKTLITTIAGLQLALQAFNNEGVQKVIISIREWIAAKIAARAASKAQQAEAKATATAMVAEAAATQTATAATNAFKKALIATGIGAVVVALGALIANWDKLTNLLGRAEQYQRKMNKAMAEGAGNAAEEVVQLKILEAVATDVTRAEEERSRAATLLLDKLDETINATSIAAVKNGEYADSVAAVTNALVQQARAEAALDLIKEKQAEILKKQTQANQFAAKNPTLWDNIVAGASQGTATAADVHAARVENKQTQVQNLQKEFDDWLKHLIKSLQLSDFGFAGSESGSGGSGSGSGRSGETTSSAISEAEEDIQAVLDAEEAHIEWAMNLDAMARQARIDGLHEEVVAHNDALMEQMQNEEEYQAWQDKVREEQKQKEAEFRQWQKETAISTSETLASATASMFDSIANAIEATAEDEEETAKKTKGLRIAGATMTMLQGIVSAVATAMAIPPPVGPILGAINAATVLATGTANIAKIKATDVATGSSPGGADVPSASVQIPTINRSLPATQILTSASDEARLNKIASDQRVKLVYSDLEVASTDQRVKVEESSF